MIGVVFVFAFILLLGIVAFMVLSPALSMFSSEARNAMEPIAQEVMANTNNSDLINATQSFLDSLDFQAQVFMWLAQYGWIIVIFAVFFGVFMAVRVWIEYQKTRRLI